MVVRFQTFEQIHNKRNVGSTKIRVHNLIDHWPEAGIYQYGEKPDVLIFQKAYITQDYKFPKYFDGIKILDICDPDWLEGSLIKQTVDAMDAITCPTQPLVDFISQMTDKPVRLIRDRFNMEEFGRPKKHEGKLKKVAWFGYSHNAELLKFAVPSIAKRNLQLRIIADKDPEAWRWAYAEHRDSYKDMYEYRVFKPETAYKFVQECDAVVFPKGTRPVDRFKSENKTVISKLLGIPVAENAEELDGFMTAESRNAWVDKWHDKTRKEYDVKKSVQQYKDLIKELT